MNKNLCLRERNNKDAKVLSNQQRSSANFVNL